MSGLVRRAGFLVLLVAAFARDLVQSSIAVARAVLSREPVTSPRFVVVSVRHDLTETEITMVANYITLTPGTLSVDVSDDRSAILVHALSDLTGDAVRADVRDNIEARVIRVTRS